MAYAVGHVSGGHFNPAVTLGAALAGRLPWKLTVPYWIAQLVGGVAAGGVLLAIASGRPGYSLAENGLATNGYGELSPAGYSMGAVFLTEALLTAVFLYIILGATDRRAPSGFAPLAIGLTLTLIHLISIPVSNTSVNPARSFGVALFAGGDALGQVWLFFVAPLLGAAVAGLSYRFVFPNSSRMTEELPEPALPWVYGVAKNCLANAERGDRPERRAPAEVLAHPGRRGHARLRWRRACPRQWRQGRPARRRRAPAA